MRFINFNLAQDDATVVTSSSNKSNYPALNIKHEFRNKIWRSNANGYFLVNSSNNKIDFKETAMGGELTATLTSGNYTASTLAAEIKTQMESVSVDTFTVTYSQVTGLWTIASSGSYLSLLINSGTNQANNTLKNSLGYSNTDRTGQVSYVGTTVAIHTQEHITFDMITSEDVDSVCLLWPKEDGIKLSSTAVLKVQANATNSWTSPAVDQTLTINNTYVVASHFFSTPQSYRYWRIVIIDPTNANLEVTLGVAVIGKSLDIQNPDIGFEFEVADQSKVVTNAFGNQYVDEYPSKSTLSIKYGLLDYDEAQALENAYRINGTRIPVFVTVDHEDTTFDKNHFLIYGKMVKPQKISQIHYKYFGSDLVVEEIS